MSTPAEVWAKMLDEAEQRSEKAEAQVATMKPVLLAAIAQTAYWKTIGIHLIEGHEHTMTKQLIKAVDAYNGDE